MTRSTLADKEIAAQFASDIELAHYVAKLPRYLTRERCIDCLIRRFGRRRAFAYLDAFPAAIER